MSNKKIDIPENEKEIVLKELDFNSKYKIVKKIFDLNGCNTKIEKINEARNYVAHNEINSLADLQNIEKDRKVKGIKKIKKFSDLIGYIAVVDELIANISAAKPNKF